jgi:hypothetical protein
MGYSSSSRGENNMNYSSSSRGENRNYPLSITPSHQHESQDNPVAISCKGCGAEGHSSETCPLKNSPYFNQGEKIYGKNGAYQNLLEELKKHGIQRFHLLRIIKKARISTPLMMALS